MTKHTFTPDPKNANRGTVRGLGMVERSLQQYGAGRSILASADGVILAGNKTFDRAMELGIPVQEIESDGKTLFVIKRTDLAYDDPRAKELAIADNRASETGLDWDADVLQSFMDDGVDLDQFWFEDELDLLLNGEDDEPMGGNTDPDDVPEVPEEPITKRGDLWQLGRHRLLCGDSTVVTDVDRLMDGQKADMVFTDPPYGMNLDTDFSTIKGSMNSIGRAKGTQGNTYSPVIGDGEDYDPSFLMTYFSYVKEQFWFGADYYAEMIPNRKAGSWLVWDKRKESQADAIGSEFELCWSKQKHKRRMLRHDWFGFLSSENTADARNRVHPTQKPVTLLVDMLTQWGKGCVVIVDPYGGSGSTLIACEQTNRTCYGMELDPHYCDVIVRRWENFTGQTATLADETSMVKE